MSHMPSYPIRVLTSRIRMLPLQTRMPFRYGIATMTSFPLAFLEVICEIQGKRVSGWSLDLLLPKGFTKEPKKDTTEEIREMSCVIQQACQIASGLSGANPL